MLSLGRSLSAPIRIIALIATLVILATSASAQDMKFFKIASGSAGGTYFPIAGLIANAISNPPGSRPCDKGGACGVPGLVAIAMSSNGSVANVNGIDSGTIDSGFSQADVAYWAYTGTGVFDGKPPMKKLRLLASLYPETMHVVVRKDSQIRTIPDLKGKRVNIGLQASGAKVAAVLILEAHGLKENVDYKAEYLNNDQAIDRMRDGQLDANLTATGYPQAATAELATAIGARLLPVEGEAAAAIKRMAPFYSDSVIPAGVYKDIDTETKTLAVMAQWLVSADAGEDLVYQISAALWNKNSRELLDNGHVKGKAITMKTALDGAGIPLHPGAARFYGEKGVKLP